MLFAWQDMQMQRFAGKKTKNDGDIYSYSNFSRVDIDYIGLSYEQINIY